MIDLLIFGVVFLGLSVVSGMVAVRLHESAEKEI